MEIAVRRLLAEDASAYWTLRLEAVETQPLSFGPTPSEHRLTTIEDAIALLSAPAGFLVGAFDGDALVGIARFAGESGEKERHKGHIYGVYVTASHRQRGIARRLILAIVSEAKGDPYLEQLLLSVGVFNQGARSLYLALGFVPYGIEPRSLRVGSEYIDEENMILRLR